MIDGADRNLIDDVRLDERDRRPARILVVARSTIAHPNCGGMEQSMKLLYESLMARGHDVALLSTHLPDGKLGETFPEFVKTWAISVGKPGRYSIKWWYRTWRSGPWIDWRPDLVLGIGDAAGGLIVRPRRRYRTAIQCHGTTLAEARSARATPGTRSRLKAALNVVRTPSRVWFLRKADEVWAVGPAVQEQLFGAPYRLARERVQVFYNAVDRQAFEFDPAVRANLREKLGISVNTTVALVIGRLDRQKGVDIAIEALAMAQERDILLLVVGQGDERARLVRLAAQHSLGGRVLFLGKASAQEVSEYLSASDVLLFPTRRIEGLPMVLLEAAAGGLPVIATVEAQIPVESSSQVTVVWGSAGEFAKALFGFVRRDTRASYLHEKYSLETFSSTYAKAVEASIRDVRGSR